MKLKKIAGIALAVLMSVSVFAGCKDPNADVDPLLKEPLKASAENTYTRFTESWRSVKQEGWAINKKLEAAGNEAKLNRALKLFDYLFSKEGNQIMSYGPDAWVAHNDDGSVKTILYNGKQVPQLSDEAIAELKSLEKGNYTNYYRNWLGGTMPVGYVKEQGMEYQTVHEKGKPGLANILKAIELDTIDHLQVTSDSNFVWTNETSALSTDAEVELKMGVLYQGKSKIRFVTENVTEMKSKANSDGSWTAADGNTYGDGDLKPVWKALSEKLNIDFEDVTGTQDSVAKNYAALVTNGYASNPTAFDIITGGATDIVRDGVGNDGKFVNLLDYINKMPNMKRFLEANPFVKASCLAGDDAMYYAPYFDGFDDIERMFMMRNDWVEKLLDGETAPAFDTAKALDAVAYTPFMPETMNKTFSVVNAEGTAATTVTKNYAKNIITIQNELSAKNGKTLTEALRDYIDSTYGTFYGNNRSQLFIGVNAAYDADELVALFRCVRTNPALLNGSANADIVPFYPRYNTADRVFDLYRLMSIWGVRGLDARNNFFFVDSNGDLKDSRVEPRTIAALAKLNELYKEKLILQDFDRSDAVVATPSWASEASFRNRLNAQNRGFMTYDYNQTSAVVNGLGDGENPDIPGFDFGPVLPPFTDWGFATKPLATDKAFSTVPTAFAFDEGAQETINSYRNMVGTTSRFWIAGDNGKAASGAAFGLSDVVWSDAIIKGFGADVPKGEITYKFSSMNNFFLQVRDDWNGKGNLNVSGIAYKSFIAKYNAVIGA